MMPERGAQLVNDLKSGSDTLLVNDEVIPMTQKCSPPHQSGAARRLEREKGAKGMYVRTIALRSSMNQ
jgi:hypothetical protein